MLSTIDFDHQSSFEAHEVENEIAKWMLPTKFETSHFARSKELPETALGVGEVSSQSTLESWGEDRFVGLAEHWR